MEAVAGNTVKIVPATDEWLEWPGRRKYHSVDFYPGLVGGKGLNPKSHADGVLNLWTSWGVDPSLSNLSADELNRSVPPESCSQFHELVHNAFGSGNGEYTQYIYDWLCWSIANPARPAEVAIVFRGGKGIGKGSIAQVIGKIVGDSFWATADMDHVIGNFNGNLKSCSSDQTRIKVHRMVLPASRPFEPLVSRRYDLDGIASYGLHLDVCLPNAEVLNLHELPDFIAEGVHLTRAHDDLATEVHHRIFIIEELQRAFEVFRVEYIRIRIIEALGEVRLVVTSLNDRALNGSDRQRRTRSQVHCLIFGFALEADTGRRTHTTHVRGVEVHLSDHIGAATISRAYVKNKEQ
ncbi:hypothetical protein [Achromobacter phage ewik_TL4]|nr:hypothetical protein [Achromobacter phage ewik_TL4]